MSDLAKTIGQRLRNHRIAQHLSQEKLAELAGCHPTYIGQVERGEKNATLDSIHMIATALRVPLSQLFEKLGTTEEKTNDMALQFYEFAAEKTKKEQEQLYRILMEIDRYGK